MLNRFVNQCPDILDLKGLEMYKWAVALLATSSASLSLAIFSRADARPSGYLVNNAPDASAKNSLFLETAN